VKARFIESARAAFRRGLAKFRNQLSVFLLCLALSVFLWVLVKLSKEYYYTVDYRLKYTHAPVNLRLASVSDSILSLKLRIQGYDFFTERLFIGQENTYEVNLRRIRLHFTDGGARGFMLTNSLGYDIAAQTSYTHAYVAVSPDTLFFEFERRGYRKPH
jgi:hypothetical protein